MALGGNLQNFADLATGAKGNPIARILLGIGSGGMSELAMMASDSAKEKQAANLQDIGNVLSGQATPAFARAEFTPEQLQQNQIKQLFGLGTPEAAQIGAEFIETPEDKLRKEKLRAEINLANTRAKGSGDRTNLMKELFSDNPTSYGKVTEDITTPEGIKTQIATFKQKNKQLSAGLLDPQFKDFANAQIQANNEEIKNLRQIAKESREVEAGMTPDNAAKTSLVKKGVSDVGEIFDLLAPLNEETGEREWSNRAIASMNSVNLNPFGDDMASIPFTKGRRAQSKLFNAVNAQLRAESGAAVPESEVKRAMRRFSPSLYDDDTTKAEKLTSLQQLLEGTLSGTKAPGRIKGTPVTETGGWSIKKVK